MHFFKTDKIPYHLPHELPENPARKYDKPFPEISESALFSLHHKE